jgi:cytochrome c oxidase subunit II
MQILPVRPMFSVLIVLLGAFGTMPQAQVPGSDQSTKVIEVSAKKYDFTPSEIHVKKGTKVELKVHSVDEPHGIKLALHPKGSKDKSSAGLVFADPAANGKVEKDKDQVLEFVAEKAGTYEFECAKFCGFGHRRMKGKLVVDE